MALTYPSAVPTSGDREAAAEAASDPTAAPVRGGGGDAALGLGVFALTLALYAATACPTVYWYDSAEFATAAAVGGIPHPPGYPTYVLIGWLATRGATDPAATLNGLSAVFGALAAALAYGLGRQLGAGRIGAALGAGFVATNPVLWDNATMAEVYAPATAWALGTTWVVAWASAQRRPALLVLAAALAGLGLGVHLSLATIGAGLALWVLTAGVADGAGVGRRTLADVRAHLWARLGLAVACAGAAALAAAAVYGAMMLRARLDPPLNVYAPTTVARVLWNLSGGPYSAAFLPIADIGRWTLALVRLWWLQLGSVGLALGLAGVVLLARVRPRDGAALGLAIAGNLWFFWNYFVHDVEVFFLPAMTLLAVAAGVAVTAIAARGRGAALAISAVAVVGVVVQLGFAFPYADKAERTDAREWADAVARALPEGATIVTFTTPPEWHRHTVFGLYDRIVLGRRPDVRLVLAPSRAELRAWLDAGGPVYIYAAIERLAPDLEWREEGPLLRLVRFRETPEARAREAGDEWLRPAPSPD
jgi:hypothetical protein